MKKFLISLAVVCMISLLAVSAFAAGNYPSNNADWGVTVKTEADGSVTITVDKDKVEASADGFTYGYSYIAIYDADQNFTADSDMTRKPEETQAAAFNDAVAGPGNVGMVDAVTYTVKKGDATDLATGTYKFEDGKKYYAYVCACDGSGWVWNYKAVEFTYGEKGQETADLSVIAYAVAALTGCGALVIAKRK